MSIKRLFICCNKDNASVNICEHMVSDGGWEDHESEGVHYRTNGNDLMLVTDERHITTDNLDQVASSLGFDPDVVIYPSRHSAKSGMPALTVHPIGNYHENEFGGMAGTLVKACPTMMSDCLRRIKAICDIPEYNVCFEATHHGPYLDKPTFFIEIGSDENYWGRDEPAEVQSKVLETVQESNDYPVMIGIGGGHYAPRFTEVALGYKANFGHILPNYQMDGREDEDIMHCMELAAAATGTKLAYLHKKSMKSSRATAIKALGESIGLEFLRSEDLEPLE